MKIIINHLQSSCFELSLKVSIKNFIKMLYIKEKSKEKRRSYDYLHNHDVTSKAKKRRKTGRVTLSGKPKE